MRSEKEIREYLAMLDKDILLLGNVEKKGMEWRADIIRWILEEELHGL